MLNNLLKLLEQKTATIGVIGMGYVGLPLAIRCSEEFHRVIGFDILQERVQDLQVKADRVLVLKRCLAALDLQEGR